MPENIPGRIFGDAGVASGVGGKMSEAITNGYFNSYSLFPCYFPFLFGQQTSGVPGTTLETELTTIKMSGITSLKSCQCGGGGDLILVIVVVVVVVVVVAFVVVVVVEQLFLLKE